MIHFVSLFYCCGQFFVGTTGSTADGEPYVARYRNAVGNPDFKVVPRPQMLGFYYRYSNLIDTGNQGDSDSVFVVCNGVMTCVHDAS